MSWLKDPFRRFLNIYGTLIILSVLLLLFTRETINDWVIENSAIPLLEAEVGYLYQAWEEDGSTTTKNALLNEQESIFTYQFKTLIQEQQLPDFRMSDAELSTIDYEQLVKAIDIIDTENIDATMEVISTDIYLPMGNKWQPVTISINQSFFDQQINFIDRLFYGVIAIMFIGYLAASFMIHSIKKHLTNINKSSTEIRQLNNLQLRMNKDELEGPLAQTIGEINQMLEGLENSADKTRQQANNIAHDLRTPLTSVYQRVQSLSQNNPELIDVEKMIEKLLSTFNLLLKISRLESADDPIELTQLSVLEVIEDAVELYLPVIEDCQQQLTLNIAPEHQFSINPESMFHVLCNLLDNTCKFNSKGGDIAIWSQADNNGLTLYLADQSGGVGETEINKLCDKFYHSDNSRQSEGNGLGLSLVFAATKKMGGELQLTDSILNGKLGLKVAICFPIPLNNDTKK